MQRLFSALLACWSVAIGTAGAATCSPAQVGSGAQLLRLAPEQGEVLVAYASQITTLSASTLSTQLGATTLGGLVSSIGPARSEAGGAHYSNYFAQANGEVARVVISDPEAPENWRVPLGSGAGCNVLSIVAAPALHQRATATAAFQARYANDLIYVGTTGSCTNGNRIYGLDADSGAVRFILNEFGSLSLDRVLGLVLDVPNDRLYVTTDQRISSNDTIHAFDLVSGVRVWSAAPGPIWSDALLRNGRIYVATTTGALAAYDAASGALAWVTTPSPPRGFVSMPAMAAAGPSADVLLAADFRSSEVVAVRDDGTEATPMWSAPVGSNAVLRRPIVTSSDGTRAFIAGSSGTVAVLAIEDGRTVETLDVPGSSAAVDDIERQGPSPGLAEAILVSTDGTTVSRLCPSAGARPATTLPVPALATAVFALGLLGAASILASRRQRHAPRPPHAPPTTPMPPRHP